MTQSQFMYKLMVELTDLPDEKKYVIMNEYTQFFDERLDRGMSEEQIAEALPAPKVIAQAYKDGSPLPIGEMQSIYDGKSSSRTAASVFKFICLIPVAVLYFPIVTVLGLALFLIAVALCAACVCMSVFSFTAVPLQTGFILTGIGGIFFTLTFLFLSILIFKGVFVLLKIFPAFMGSVLNNGKARHSV